MRNNEAGVNIDSSHTNARSKFTVDLKNCRIKNNSTTGLTTAMSNHGSATVQLTMNGCAITGNQGDGLYAGDSGKVTLQLNDSTMLAMAYTFRLKNVHRLHRSPLIPSAAAISPETHITVYIVAATSLR